MSKSYEYQTIVRKHTAVQISKNEFHEADLGKDNATGYRVTKENGDVSWMSKEEHESNFELSGGEGK